MRKCSGAFKWLPTDDGVVRSESSGVEEGAGDVVGEVAKAQGGPAQVFETAVDGLRGPVAGAGSVEEGQDVLGAPLQGASQCDQLLEFFGDALGQRGDHGPQLRLAGLPIWGCGRR